MGIRLRSRSKSLSKESKPCHSFVEFWSCEIFALYSEYFLSCIFMMILFQIQWWLIRNQTKLNCWTAFSAAFWRFFSILAKKSSSVLIACISSSLLKKLNGGFVLKSHQSQTSVYWETHHPTKTAAQNRKMIAFFVRYTQIEYKLKTKSWNKIWLSL